MKIILYLSVIVLCSSCSYKVLRTDYQATKSNYKDCEIAIKKNVIVTDSMQRVGEIELKDTGFTFSCSENEALELLKKEGCALEANLINIKEEHRADFKSTCYRCKAEFYRVKTNGVLTTDKEFAVNDVNERVKSDRKKNAGIFILSFSVGFLAIAAAQ